MGVKYSIYAYGPYCLTHSIENDGNIFVEFSF